MLLCFAISMYLDATYACEKLAFLVFSFVFYLQFERFERVVKRQNREEIFKVFAFKKSGKFRLLLCKNQCILTDCGKKVSFRTLTALWQLCCGTAQAILKHFFAWSSLGNLEEYFTAIMLKKSRVKILKQEIIAFPTTAMKRNLLVVHVSESGCTKQLYFCLPNKKSQERLNWLFLYDSLKEQKNVSSKHINPVVFETGTSFMLLYYLPSFVFKPHNV